MDETEDTVRNYHLVGGQVLLNGYPSVPKVGPGLMRQEPNNTVKICGGQPRLCYGRSIQDFSPPDVHKRVWLTPYKVTITVY